MKKPKNLFIDIKSAKRTQNETDTQAPTQTTPTTPRSPIPITPALIAQFKDHQNDQPQQWQYLHRIESKTKIGLGVSRRTGRVQWCPNLTCCKLLILLPVIMLPIILVLLLLMRMNGMLLALSQSVDSQADNNQDTSYYFDEYADFIGHDEDLDSHQSNLTQSEINDLNQVDHMKRCLSFRYMLSEKNDIEDHDILKDARTSFLPMETAALPKECLEHDSQGNRAVDYNGLPKSTLRKRARRTSGDVSDSNTPGETDSAEHAYSENEDSHLTEMLSALQNFWGDKSNKDSIRRTQAKTMLQYINPKINPCIDFYKYACGNWIKVHPIPRDKAGFDTFEMLRENLDLVLKDLLESSNRKITEPIKGIAKKVVEIPNNNFELRTNTQADIVPETMKETETAESLKEEQKFIDHIMSKRDILTRMLRRHRRQTVLRRKRLTILDLAHNQNDAIRKARDFYKSCTNIRLIQRRGIRPLLSLIDSFGGWPVLDPHWDGKKFDWLNLTAELRRYNNDIFIVEWVGPDIKNSDENIIQFDQTSLGLPTREYFLHDINSKYLRAYQIFMSAIMQGLGATVESAEMTSAELINFETKLAYITSPAEQRLNVTKLYKRMTLGQLHKHIPDIDWTRYLSILQSRKVSSNEQIVIYAMDYMQRLVSLIDLTDKRVVSNYLLWRFIRHRINNVDDRFEDSKQHFYHTLFGREESPSRWKICIAQVNTNMGMALGSLFVRRYFDENSKLDTLKMTHELQQAFREILGTTDWLDQQTKYLAELKVNAMSLKIGYPDFILNPKELNEKYKGIVVHPDRYFENTLNVLLHTAKTEQMKLREPVNKTTWQTAPAIVNAYYSRNKNQIMFPAGILQPPFYHRHFPRSLNFGGIGVVIGHELTHGFDDKGRLFDRNGSIHKWWSDASIRGFDERARCIIAQYGNYTVDEVGVTLNGESTQGENIADNGGLRQAFHAYKRWLQQNPNSTNDERLPGINMTGEQLFFLNFGQVWCGAMRPEAVRNKLNTAIHSPGRFRVIGTVSNSEDFAREFRCPRGSPMNPIRKCSVW